MPPPRPRVSGVVGGPQHLPPVPGAYVLLIETRATVTLAIAGASAALPQGWYLYCGNANGPGGIRARVRRHLKRRKPLHWHVDRLTAKGRVRAVIVAPGGTECALFARLAALPNTGVPVAGFGASDCRRCPSHLLRMDGFSPGAPELPLGPSEYLLAIGDGLGPEGA